MDFVRYAERAADLVNASIADEAGLRAYLAYRPWLAERVAPRDVPAVRRLQRNLRGLFGTDADSLVSRLNDLMRQHPVSPYISGHDEQSLHMHVAEKASSVAETMAAESLMGMAVVVCDHGTRRFGLCDGEWCDRVYVDTSPNLSRRYCSDRCSSRANVAAFRARSKARTDARAETRVDAGEEDPAPARTTKGSTAKAGPAKGSAAKGSAAKGRSTDTRTTKALAAKARTARARTDKGTR